MTMEDSTYEKRPISKGGGCLCGRGHRPVRHFDCRVQRSIFVRLMARFPTQSLLLKQPGVEHIADDHIKILLGSRFA